MAKKAKTKTTKSRSGKSGWASWKAKVKASLDTAQIVSLETEVSTHIEKHDKACQTEPTPTEPDSPKWRLVSNVPRQLVTINQQLVLIVFMNIDKEEIALKTMFLNQVMAFKF